MCNVGFGLGNVLGGPAALVFGFLMLGRALGPPALAQATNCHVPPPSFWLTNVIRQVVTENFPDSFMLTEIRDLPRGYTVSNGFYIGWCVDYDGPITPGNVNQAEMYYSYGELPPYLQHANWDLVNYLLNHKQGNSVDVQYAIWHFIGGPVPSGDRRFYPPKAPALAMIIDAMMHGEGFVPALGQVSAVILVPEEQRQINIIEVACPPPPVCIYQDYAYHDLNANGVRDGNEPALIHAPVALTDCEGNILATAETDPTGYFTIDITNAVPASFRLALLNPPFAYQLVRATPGFFDENAMTRCFILSNDCLVLPPPPPRTALLGDVVWEDLNGNGVQEAGEPGLGGVTVRLLDCDGNLIETTTTEANGSYLFAHLVAGNYRLGFVAPAGFAFTEQDEGFDHLDSDANRSAGLTPCLILSTAETNLAVDAGLVRLATAGTFVWQELNLDGVYQQNEPGLDSIAALLCDEAGHVIANSTTDGTGFCWFDNLMPGHYLLTLSTPPGCVFAGYTLNSEPAQVTSTIVVTSGEVKLTAGAGVIVLGSIGDRVWHDLNSNGLQDGDEPGLSSVLVRLYDCAGNIITATHTSANGSFLFSGLRPASYKITFVAPAGYIFTRQHAGGAETDSDANPTNGTTACLTLGSGETKRDIDAGLKRTLRYTTHTQADWGATARANNVAGRLFRRWSTLYRQGLMVGGTYKIMLTSQRAIDQFLPASGAPAALRKNYGNPLRTEAGAFAGEIVALKINVDFSTRSFLPPGLASLKIAPGNKLAGLTVGEILALAHQVLGGRLAALPPGCTLADLHNVVLSINANFANGGDLGYLVR